MGIADAIYSVQALGHCHDRGVYDAAWAGAAILVAYAAWQPHPGRLEPREVIGWRAIVLAIAAQALAVSIQIYAIFDEVPHSERILTVFVLIIATIQIVSTRPRPQSPSSAKPGPSAAEVGSGGPEPRSAAAKPGRPQRCRPRRENTHAIVRAVRARHSPGRP